MVFSYSCGSKFGVLSDSYKSRFMMFSDSYPDPPVTDETHPWRGTFRIPVHRILIFSSAAPALGWVHSSEICAFVGLTARHGKYKLVWSRHDIVLLSGHGMIQCYFLVTAWYSATFWSRHDTVLPSSHGMIQCYCLVKSWCSVTIWSRHDSVTVWLHHYTVLISGHRMIQCYWLVTAWCSVTVWSPHDTVLLSGCSMIRVNIW